MESEEIKIINEQKTYSIILLFKLMLSPNAYWHK